jgi:hypothetical protein
LRPLSSAWWSASVAKIETLPRCAWAAICSAISIAMV